MESKKQKPVSKPLHCELCGMAFALTTCLSAHKTIEHQADPPHKCSVCSVAFFDASAYGAHILKHSLQRGSSSDYFKCCECSLEYPSEHGLRVHISQHTGLTLQRRGKSVQKRNPFLICEYCPAILREEESFREHLKIHDLMRPYECEQCHLTFRVKGQLDFHKQRHEDLKNLPKEAVDRFFKQIPFGGMRIAKQEKS